ncbi:MAG: (2Fe-2S)-binding protein [bacterium]|nr:(2Fe-2S)-binding protein [bacterium]
MSRAPVFLCKCEDVTLREFRQAYGEGFTELESLKRYTGVGTGFCQGKGCLSESAIELANLRGISPEEVRLTNIRPPAEPLTFAELAALDVPEPASTPQSESLVTDHEYPATEEDKS